VNLRDVPDERGLSGYDRRFNDTTTMTYALPAGHGWARYFYGGWRSSVINSMYSGQPVNLTWNPAANGQLRADATINSHRSNRIVPGGQNRVSFEAKTTDLFWIG